MFQEKARRKERRERARDGEAKVRSQLIRSQRALRINPNLQRAKPKLQKQMNSKKTEVTFCQKELRRVPTKLET